MTHSRQKLRACKSESSGDAGGVVHQGTREYLRWHAGARGVSQVVAPAIKRPASIAPVESLPAKRVPLSGSTLRHVRAMGVPNLAPGEPRHRLPKALPAAYADLRLVRAAMVALTPLEGGPTPATHTCIEETNDLARPSTGCADCAAGYLL